MDLKLLTEIGLTPQQAKTYVYLSRHGTQAPPVVAAALGESRTNTYNVLEKLVEFGLVSRFRQNKRYVFRAEPPTVLEKLAQQKRDAALQQERELHALMPAMLSQYFIGNEQPGVRFFQGKSELKNIYMDQIETKKPIYIIRPSYNMDLYDFEYMSEIRHLARRAGIQRYAITPDRVKAPKNYKESDSYMLLDRTWLPAKEYTAAVEWNAYGDKLAVMSFGDEAIGMIIDSPQIAEAFRQLYKIMESGLRRRPDYGELPKHARYKGSTSDKN